MCNGHVCIVILLNLYMGVTCTKKKDDTQFPQGLLHGINNPLACFNTYIMDFVTD